GYRLRLPSVPWTSGGSYITDGEFVSVMATGLGFAILGGLSSVMLWTHMVMVGVYVGALSAIRACRTLEAYTGQGAWDRGWSPTHRRSFGPGARTETHAGRPESLAPLRHGPARRVLVHALRASREATGNRHEAGGVVGPRRQEKHLMGLDGHTHRRRSQH